MKKATIIIPVYNSEKYIKRCMESILSQIDETFEVLLINDGSNDRSEDIIDSYAKKYPGIVRVISKKNEGTAKTRNLGIREARGEFIFFIDNDDFVDDGYFKRFINAIDEKSDIVVGGYRRVEDKKVRFQSFPKNSSWYKFTVVAPWAKIYKREFLLKNDISFLDCGLGEDVYFNIVAYSTAKSVKVIEYVGYNWYFNTKSISNTSQRGFNPDLNVVYVLDKIYQRKDWHSTISTVHFLENRVDDCVDTLCRVHPIMPYNLLLLLKNYQKKLDVRFLFLPLLSMDYL